MADGITVTKLNAWFGPSHVLHDIDLAVAPRAVTAIIGPSGCGKSTFIRCLNRMHEVVPGARVVGTVLQEGQDIYSPGVDPVEVRRRIGMVFQKPNPFPTMTVFDNVAAGLRLGGVRDRGVLNERVERALHAAALWEEVKDRLGKPGAGLSGGQQQRLCIARALLGARSDRHRAHRGADPRAQARSHHRDRHAQHAAGGAGGRRDRVFPAR